MTGSSNLGFRAPFAFIVYAHLRTTAQRFWALKVAPALAAAIFGTTRAIIPRNDPSNGLHACVPDRRRDGSTVRSLADSQNEQVEPFHQSVMH